MGPIPLYKVVGEGGDLPITSLAYDSRSVRDGSLFFCVPGLRQDGHRFAADAVQRGAAALVVERPLGLGVPEVLTPSVRATMPLAAARYYGHPARQLRVIGVTGTNGKTTTAHMLRAILERAGIPCGLLGTVKSVIAGQEGTCALTTPESVDLQRELRAMVEGGDQACVMEVSSHGIKLGRVDGIEFGAAIFTNLTRDHLDFHDDMDDYFEAKRRLLLQRTTRPIVNLDDAYGRVLGLCDGAVTFAVSTDADYHTRGLTVSAAGSQFTIRGAQAETPVRLAMPGDHNVANALGAAAAAMELGIEADVVGRALSEFSGVPGRFERVDEGQDFTVIVDFAHTPSALERALITARQLGGERVICVFGCAGDRDAGTRAPMGAAASRLADQAILTTDDPRDEPLEDVFREVREGMDGRELVVANRETAIRQAVANARPGDIVLIAGRGHERVQRFGSVERELDDAAVAHSALRAMNRSRAQA